MNADGVQIPAQILEGICAILDQYVAGITAEEIAGWIGERTGESEVDDGERLITRQQAASQLQVSVVTVDRLIASGALEHVKIRRSVRIPASALESLIRRGRDKKNQK